MFGPNWEHSLVNKELGYQALLEPDPCNDGVIPRTIMKIFDQCQQMRDQTGIEPRIYCSFVQIYCEKLYDLFQGKAESSQHLQIREDKIDGVFVEGLSEYLVGSVEDTMVLLQRGENNRITRETKSNISSSRSHSVFQIFLEIEEKAKGRVIKSKVNLCDLAGSEKIYLEEKFGERHLQEHKSINLSLSTLGKVVSALAKSAKTVVPYRESKLTRLLKDSLGGATTTILLAAVSPSQISLEETVSTLKFADRASKIKVKAKANAFSAKDDEIVKKLKREVSHLRDLLGMGPISKHELNEQLLNLKEENHRL